MPLERETDRTDEKEREKTGQDHRPERSPRHDVHAAGVIGFLGPFHNSRMVAELLADGLDDFLRHFADGPYGEGRKQEDQGTWNSKYDGS